MLPPLEHYPAHRRRPEGDPYAPCASSSSTDEDASDPEQSERVRRLRSFLDQSPEGIWCFEFTPPVPTDLDRDATLALWLECGRLTECNDALARMYGYEQARDLHGTPLSSFIDLGHDLNLEFLQSFFDHGLRLERGTSRELDREGNERIFANFAAGVVEAGRLTRVWGSQRDVTQPHRERSERERELRLRAMEELATGVAHHFNNMLMVISGNLSLVLGTGALSRDDASALESATRAASHAAHVTRQLLSFSHLKSSAFEAVDLRGVVTTGCQLLAPLSDGRLEFELELEQPPPVLSDPRLLQALLAELVAIGERAIGGAGTLRIALAHAPAPGGEEQISLRLTYPGAPPPSDERTGAGSPLAECQTLARNLGGTLTVRGSSQATTLTFQLVTARVPPEPEASSQGPAARPRPATVLVVEDEPEVLATIQRFLHLSGYRVLTASSGADALEIVARHGDLIDVVLADVLMPDKTGVEVCREIAARWPSLRLTLMSGRGDHPARAGSDLHHVPTIVKPFSKTELDRHLRQLLAPPD